MLACLFVRQGKRWSEAASPPWEAVARLAFKRLKSDDSFANRDPDEKVQGAAVFALGYLPPNGRAATALAQLAADPARSAQLRAEAQRKLKYHQPG